jgi:hypothetical protein
VVRNLRTALAGSLEAVFESGVIERPAEIYGWSPAVFGYDTLTSGQDERRPSRRRGAAQCPSDPVCGQAGRKSETTLGIACLHFEIGAFPGASADQFELPAGAADAGHRTKSTNLPASAGSYSVTIK